MWRPYGIFLSSTAKTTVTMLNTYVNGGAGGFFVKNTDGIFMANCGSDNLDGGPNGNQINIFLSSIGEIVGFFAENNTVPNYRAVMLFSDSLITLKGAKLIGNTLTGAGESYVVKNSSSGHLRLVGCRLNSNTYSGTGNYSTIMPDTDTGSLIIDQCAYSAPTGSGGTAYDIYPYNRNYALRDGNVMQEVLKPAFAVHKNGTDQTISTDTDTVVTWSTEDFDNSSAFALNRFTPDVPGKYSLNASVMYASAIDQGYYRIRLKKNGSLIKQVAVRASGTGAFSINISTEVSANGVDDYFEISTEHDSGVDKVLSGNSANTYFSGCMIGG